MSEESPAVRANRELLENAQAKGKAATLGAFVKLSGPGWLQSAITLGGGSLSGALFLGILGGTSLLWLQLVAITMGVIMLSAIAYVTLSTNERPFQAINTHINPALGWGWLIATSLANMIWCMPQFGLCYAALDKNLVPGGLAQKFAGGAEMPSDTATLTGQLVVSVVILLLATGVVLLNAQRGRAAKVFDWLLKGLVGMVVVCFFGVVAYLSSQGHLHWGSIFAGFIPNLSQATEPTGDVASLIAGLTSEQAKVFWSGQIVGEQRNVMIAAAATAVGINMTFLMPYSMLHRGWDKPFRGLARFDLCTGMAIPYVLVTSCVVIASAYTFHGKADVAFLSSDPAVMQTSPLYGGASKLLIERVDPEATVPFADLDEAAQARVSAEIAALPEAEKRVAASLVKRNAFELSAALAPLIGEDMANYVFGLGVFGMGFSTIIILMLINGFVFCEVAGKPDNKILYMAGCLVAGLVGASWPFIWRGDTQFWFTILASTFAAVLMPIAYVAFFMMMNSRSLMGGEMPTGGRRLAWNLLMGFSVLGAFAYSATAVYDKVMDKKHPFAGQLVLGFVIVYLLLVAAGFALRSKGKSAET